MGEIEIGFLTIIVGLTGINATMIRMMMRRYGNGKPKPHHPDMSNPHPYNPDDLRNFRLGDMSAAWYVEKHNELLVSLDAIKTAIEAGNGN